MLDRAVDDKPSDTLVVVPGEGSWTGSSTLPHLHQYLVVSTLARRRSAVPAQEADLLRSPRTPRSDGLVLADWMFDSRPSWSIVPSSRSSVSGAGVTMDPNEPKSKLETRLARGHQRVDSAAPGSPEWDAAQANVVDLEHRLHALQPIPLLVGSHIVSRLGPMVLEDDCLIHGIIAAPGPAGDALRVEIAAIPDRVHSRDEFAMALEELAQREDFVIEIEGHERELTFYAWDRELHDARSRD